MIEETVEKTPKPPLIWATEVARRRGLPRAVLIERKKGSSQSVLLLEFTTTSQKPRQTRLSILDLPQRLRGDIYGDF